MFYLAELPFGMHLAGLDRVVERAEVKDHDGVVWAALPVN